MDPAESQRIDIVTEDARRKLGNALMSTTVSIERVSTLKDGVTLPGGLNAPRKGWLFLGKYVFTASFGLVAGPYEASVTFTVNAMGRKSRARVVASDVRIGAAVLVLENPFNPPPTISTVRRKPSDIWLGRPGFALLNGDVPTRLLFALPRAGDFEYYWRLSGQLPLGTPVTDAHGTLLSFVGMHHPTVPMLSLVLPTSALKWCLDQIGQLK